MFITQNYEESISIKFIYSPLPKIIQTNSEQGELPLAVQPKLLRALKENMIRCIGDNRGKSVNVRLISATNRNLETAVADRTFRDDLFWRF